MHDQVLIVLDADDTVALDAVEAMMPAERRERWRHSYRQCGGPALKRHGPEQTPVDWTGVGHAIGDLADKARHAATQSDRAVDYWITGKAPLPAFVQLGMTLSTWLPTQTLLNQRADGRWDVVGVGVGADEAKVASPFDLVKGVGLAEPSVTTARVAVYIDTAGRHPPIDAIRAYLQDQGEELGALIEIRASAPATLDASNATAAFRHLKELFARLPGDYPNNNGLALFIAGPVTLAYLVGRAINLHQFRDILLPDFSAGRYVHALTLPLGSRAPFALDNSSTSELRRRKVLDELLNGIEELRAGLTRDHLAPYTSGETSRQILETLQSLQINRTPEGDAFNLSILRRHLSLGGGLLEALAELPEALQRRIGQLLILHELRHYDQNLLSTNYRDVGRAGVALEEIDYVADAFAIGAAANWELATGGRHAQPAGSTVELIDAHIQAMLAFDRSEQGLPLKQLGDRRLRRYLIWHLQRSRAGTLRKPEDIAKLLMPRLIVELAPLDCYLDPRHDRMVRKARPDAQLFVVLDGKLMRISQQPGSFTPAELETHVRNGNGRMIEAAMEFVLEQGKGELVGWMN